MSRDYSRRLAAGTKVSKGTPIGRNVTAHFPLVRDFLSAVRGRPGLGVSTGPFLRPDPTGKAAMGIGAGKISTGLLPSELGMDGAKARTVIVEFQQNDATGSQCVFSFGDTSGNTRTQFSLLMATTFRRVTLQTYANDVNYTLWDQGGTYARVFLAITYDGNRALRVRSHCRVFLNDGTPQGVVSRSFSTTLGGALVTGDTFPLELMGGGTYGFASMNTQLFNATFIGNRALTEREIDNFYRNQQQIMTEAPSFPYALLGTAAPAPNNYTLTALPGSFGLAGTSASMRVSRKLAGGNGSFSLTGIAATLRAGRRVVGATGVITLASAAASVTASRKLAAAPGVFALAGSNASLTVARRLAAAAGAFTLAGGAAQLVYSPAPEAAVIVAASGQFVMTGAAVSMRVTRRLQAQLGSFALAGSAAEIRYSGQTIAVIDATKVPIARTVTFDGCIRTVVFKGGIRTTVFAGGTRTVRF